VPSKVTVSVQCALFLRTTIIEAIKYALTGDIPAGGGKNFVHTNCLNDCIQSSTGRVRLTISDGRGTEKTVTRALRIEVSGKTKSITTKTLNTTVTFTQNGKREDISGRVDDINNYMCDAMGVSKSILNNVILCHQEDSNWPLDEGKKLKEKFDSIFGTTEYNKAIDKLIKLRKEYMAEHTSIKSDIKYNEEIKNQVELKERKIRKLKAEYDEVDVKCQKYDESLTPLQDESKKIMERERSFGKLITEKLNCKNLYVAVRQCPSAELIIFIYSPSGSRIKWPKPKS
jgi:DNA repair protein RAD50